MSQANVEIIRGSTEYFRRTGERLWDVIDPEIEIHDHDVPDGDVLRGISMAVVWTVRDQAITRLEFFLDRDQALEAAGLRE